MSRYALVIGISDYQEPFEPLSQALTDAYAVKDLLKAGQYKVSLSTNSVTRAELATQLRTFLHEQAKNSEALIYFTGHGVQKIDPLGLEKSEGFLVTSDCAVTLEDQQVTHVQGGLSFEALNTLIATSNLSSLVVLLDACHSGSFIEEALLERSLNSLKHPNCYLISACRGFEQAQAKKRGTHSVFTGALLEGLSRNKTDQDGRITSGRLTDFIYRELRASQQEPYHLGSGHIVLMEYPREVLSTPDSTSGKNLLIDLLFQAIPETVDATEMSYLLDILNLGDIEESVYRSYDACLPRDWLGKTAADLSRETTGYEDFLKILNQEIRRQESKSPPIFEFVGGLIADQKIPHGIRQKLCQWVIKNFKGESMPKTKKPHSSVVQPYLLIRVKPSKDPKEKGQFFVKAWLLTGDRTEVGYHQFQPLDIADLAEKPCSLEQIAQHFDQIHLQALGKLQDIDAKPILEFFLPQDYLCTDVDNWKYLDVSGRPVAIGTEYPVVVRSYERLLPRYRTLAMKSWRQKWSQAKQLQHPLPQNVFELLHPKEYQWTSLRATLQDKIGLKLTFPPIAIGVQSDVIAALLSTGIPIAVWPKCALAQVDLVDLINVLIESSPLFELPESVRKQRQEAVQKQMQEHLGKHLVLLWEDPDRLPPDEDVPLEFQLA